MNAEQRWKRVQELAQRLENVEKAGWAGALAGIEEDAEVREEVVRLLEAMEAEVAARERLRRREEAGETPARIGEYEVKGRIGEGGTSVVYRARKAEQREVALKVLNTYLAGAAKRERFEKEFEILSRLDHAGICRTHEMGVTAEQQPYLVLELVEGMGIDAWCDAQRLGVEGRVRLAIEAAEAIAYAHGKLVAHLDLKPGNVMVTGEGRVKVLDFGTAKVVEAAGDATSTRYLTPYYASPEQLRGEPLGVASDVYSFGLLVYRLLCGASPFVETSIAGLAERAAGATTARRMSERVTAEAALARGMTVERLRQKLRGDLEVVLGRAMAYEPEQRYRTMDELAADLRRVLREEPVMARRQTWGYRVRKFVRRNRAAVGVGVVAGMMVVTAGAYAWREERRALVESQRAEDTGNFLAWLLTSANPLYGGKQGMTVMELVQRARVAVERGTLQNGAARSYVELLLGGMIAESGGDVKGALQMTERAKERARREGDEQNWVAAGSSQMNLMLAKGNCEGAMGVAREVDARMDGAREKLRPITWATAAVAIDSARMMCGEKQVGARMEQALVRMEEVKDGVVDGGIATNLWKALVLNAVANLRVQQQRAGEGLAAAERGVGYAAREAEGGNVRIALLQTVARIAYAQKDLKKAAEALVEAAKMAEGSATPFEAIRLKVQAGQRLAEAGRREEARRLAERALRELEEQGAQVGVRRWMILMDAGITYARCEECGEALRLFEEAERSVKGKMPPAWLGSRWGFAASCLKSMGKEDEAKVAAQKALEGAGAAWGPQATMRKRMEGILRE